MLDRLELADMRHGLESSLIPLGRLAVERIIFRHLELAEFENAGKSRRHAQLSLFNLFPPIKTI